MLYRYLWNNTSRFKTDVANITSTVATFPTNNFVTDSFRVSPDTTRLYFAERMVGSGSVNPVGSSTRNRLRYLNVAGVYQNLSQLSEYVVNVTQQVTASPIDYDYAISDINNVYCISKYHHTVGGVSRQTFNIALYQGSSTAPLARYPEPYNKHMFTTTWNEANFMPSIIAYSDTGFFTRGAVEDRFNYTSPSADGLFRFDAVANVYASIANGITISPKTEEPISNLTLVCRGEFYAINDNGYAWADVSQITVGNPNPPLTYRPLPFGISPTSNILPVHGGDKLFLSNTGNSISLFRVMPDKSFEAVGPNLIIPSGVSTAPIVSHSIGGLGPNRDHIIIVISGNRWLFKLEENGLGTGMRLPGDRHIIPPGRANYTGSTGFPCPTGDGNMISMSTGIYNANSSFGSHVNVYDLNSFITNGYTTP